MFSKMSLRSKILMLCGTTLLVLLLIALALTGKLNTHSHAYKTQASTAVSAAGYIGQISASYGVQIAEMNSATPDSAERIRAEQEQVSNYLNKLDALGLNHNLQSELNSLRAHQQSLANHAYTAGSTQQFAREGSQLINSLLEQIRANSQQQIEATDQQVDRIWLTGSLSLIAFTLLSALLCLWWLNNQLINPLAHVTLCLTELSRGNFAERINSRREDELGALANASNSLSSFLSDTFANLNKNTRSLDQASDELGAIATHMSKGVEEQGLRTDQVAAAMEEMTAAAQEVASHTARASQAADDAERATQDGEQAMIEMINCITNVRDEISKTTEVILQLEDDSSRISEVLAVIHSIAEQTNLLALNAAIEAARAGESGRGFAVVADEVRNLAQRTAQSTAEINNIINAVQRGAESAVKAIESGKQSSIKGVEQVHQAGEILSGVTHSVVTIRDMSMQIATAAEEQTLVAEDISRNLTDLVAIATSNQENVRRTEQASSNLLSISRSLSQVSNYQSQ